MRSKTISQFIAATPERVYEFASAPDNLPLWVPSFCQSVERVGDEWMVHSPVGRVVFAFVARNELGVLDHVVTLADGVQLTNPMRVIPNGQGSEVMFTLFQREGMSDRQFLEDARLVQNDLQTLRRLLEAQSAGFGGSLPPK